MESTNNEEAKVKDFDVNCDHDVDTTLITLVDEHEDPSVKEQINNEIHSLLPDHEQEEEEEMKKRYGGLLPKKKSLISMDHERAFFDSADWALGKLGAVKPKGPLEALRPKLEPTPHHPARSRRSAYAHEEDSNGGNNDENLVSARDETASP